MPTEPRGNSFEDGKRIGEHAKALNPDGLPMLSGMCWYTAENYQRVRAMSDDSDFFFDTFDEWLPEAERAFQGQQASGLRVIRVVVDPDEWAAFCRERSANLDKASRVEFANHKAYEQLKAEGELR